MPKATVISYQQQTETVLPNSGASVWQAMWRQNWQQLYDFWTRQRRTSRLYFALISVAFLLGRISLWEQMSPLGLAFVLAVGLQQHRLWLPLLAASTAGAVSAHLYGPALLSGVVGVLGYWLERHWQYKRWRQLWLPLTASALQGSLQTLWYWEDASLYRLLHIATESLLLLLLIALFGMLLAQASIRKTVNGEAAGLLLFATLGIAGLGGAELVGIDIQMAVACLWLLVLAYQGAGLASAGAIAVGVLLAWSEQSSAAVLPYSVAGLLAGLCRPLGRGGMVLGFAAGWLLACLQWGSPAQGLASAAALGSGAVLFCLLPFSWLRWETESGVKPLEVAAKEQMALAVDKLGHVSGVFQELAVVFEEAGSQQKSADQQEMARVLSGVREQVCRQCRHLSNCWEEDWYETCHALLDLLGQAARGRVEVRQMPGRLRSICLRPEALLEAVLQVAERHRQQAQYYRQLSEQRQMVVEQMKAAGLVLAEVARDLPIAPVPLQDVAFALQNKAEKIGMHLSTVQAMQSEGVIQIQVTKTACRGRHECRHTLLPLAEAVVQEKLQLTHQCAPKGGQGVCQLQLKTARQLTVVTAWASAAANGICGDSCRVVHLPNGKIALLLSDGMGCGPKAAAGSHVALRLLEKLLVAGFAVETAVRTANSLLLLQQQGESFVTLDMAVIDTYTGETELLKIGAAPSFVKRVCEVGVIQTAAVPMGILQQVEVEAVSVFMASQDVLVMVSDGILDVERTPGKKEWWLQNFLRRSSAKTPQELADAILEQACKASRGRPADDMTVLVAKVLERQL